MKSKSQVLWLSFCFLAVSMAVMPAYAKRDLEAEFKKATEKANKDIQVALPHIEKAERMKPAPVKKVKEKKQPAKPKKKKELGLFEFDSDQKVEDALSEAEKKKAERQAAWAKVRLEQAKIASQLYRRLSTHEKKINRINEALAKEGQPAKGYAKLNTTLARCLILMGKSEEAVKLVESWNKPTGQYQDQSFETYFQSANVLLGHADQIIRDRQEAREKAKQNLRRKTEPSEEEKKAEEAEKEKVTRDASTFARQALVIFDWLAKHNDQTGAAGIDMVRAADGAGRAFIALREYQQAIYSLDFALKFNKDHLGDYQEDDPLEWLIPEIKSRLAYAKKKLEEQTLGPDFVLYRDAQKLRFAKKWLPARLKYRKIINEYPADEGGAYADAARLYDALCMVEMNDWKGAEKALIQFYNENPTGLYRGEVLLELGRISLEWRVDLNLAEIYFKELEEWFLKVAQEKKQMDGLFIKQAALKFISPPKEEYKKPNYWGEVEKNSIKPEMLFNRETSDWYVNDIKESCFKFYGFLFFLRKDKKNSLLKYKKIIDLDSRLRDGRLYDNPNNYTRLKWSVDNGYIYCYPEELAMYSGNIKKLVFLLDYYYINEEWDRVISLSSKIKGGYYGRLSSAQLDYMNYISGCANGWLGNTDYAASSYKKVLDKRDGTYTEYRAGYAIGKLSSYSNDRELYLYGLRVLKEFSESSIQNEFTYKCRIAYGVDLWEKGSKKSGIQVLRNMPMNAGEYKTISDKIVSVLIEVDNEE